MKSLLIIALLFFVSEIKAINDECTGTVSDINQCIGKPTGRAHMGCCGLSMIAKDSTTNICFAIGNTKAARETFKTLYEEQAKKFNATVNMVCPTQEDEIKGTCQEFQSILVNDQKDCIKLTQSDKEKSCCGLRVKQNATEQFDEFGGNLCYELPNDKTKREEEIKKMEDQTQGKVKIENYLCSSEYLNLIMLTFIYSLFLVF